MKVFLSHLTVLFFPAKLETHVSPVNNLNSWIGLGFVTLRLGLSFGFFFPSLLGLSSAGRFFESSLLAKVMERDCTKFPYQTESTSFEKFKGELLTSD